LNQNEERTGTLMQRQSISVLSNSQLRTELKNCKGTFADTFSLSLKRILVLQDMLKRGDLNTKDVKGQHMNRPHKTKGDVK
jgi:hypothetical protein